MARYIDADAILKKIFPFEGVDKRTYSINAQAIYNVICQAPIADVVSKSYVEEEKETALRYIAALSIDRRNLEANIAREIILEIDTLICCHANGDIDDKRLYRLFDELKKKYTEDQT